MQDIIIELDNCPKFEEGFIPEPGQKIFVKCEECDFLHEIVLGQGDVCPDLECTNCGEYMGDCYVTDEIFSPIDVYLIFNDEKYLKPFANSDKTDINRNIELCKAVSKVAGEAFFEFPWYINDSSNYPLNEFMEDNPDERILLIKEDTQMFLYILFHDIPLDRIYVIDKDYNVTKLNKIDISVTINGGI